MDWFWCTKYRMCKNASFVSPFLHVTSPCCRRSLQIALLLKWDFRSDIEKVNWTGYMHADNFKGNGSVFDLLSCCCIYISFCSLVSEDSTSGSDDKFSGSHNSTSIWYLSWSFQVTRSFFHVTPELALDVTEFSPFHHDSPITYCTSLLCQVILYIFNGTNSQLMPLLIFTNLCPC